MFGHESLLFGQFSCDSSKSDRPTGRERERKRGKKVKVLRLWLLCGWRWIISFCRSRILLLWIRAAHTRRLRRRSSSFFFFSVRSLFHCVHKLLSLKSSHRLSEFEQKKNHTQHRAHTYTYAHNMKMSVWNSLWFRNHTLACLLRARVSDGFMYAHIVCGNLTALTHTNTQFARSAFVRLNRHSSSSSGSGGGGNGRQVNANGTPHETDRRKTISTSIEMKNNNYLVLHLTFVRCSLFVLLHLLVRKKIEILFLGAQDHKR